MTRSKSIRRVWIKLTSDRKRFGMLVGAVCIGVLLWGRLIVVRQPPRMALAKPNATSPTASTDDASADNNRSKNSGTTAGSKSKRSPIAVELWANPKQDPFVISPDYFPKPTEFVETTKVEQKSVTNPVEEASQAEARLVAQMRASIERVRLEAALAGNMAVISGRKYRVGDAIVSQAGSSFQFRLVEIRQRSVMLECEGHQFELQMATPGS